MITIDFDPTLINLGPLQIRWYGLMYVVGFLIGGKLLNKLGREKFIPFTTQHTDAFITYMLIGMFFGARLTYVFVYNWEEYSQNLQDLFAVWKGGLSFHGAIIGFIVVMLLYGKKYKIPFFALGDAVALAGTQGLFFGRIGNFINGELYGRITDKPWGMVFPSGGPFTRHPSQLYEAFGEGILLFVVLWFIKKKVKIHGVLSAVFLFGYGFVRFIVEYFREPDAQLGLFFSGSLSMGQLLCLIMMIAGFGVLIYSRANKTPIHGV
jgi:phosphatidylglycerol:prolipoprotein diacylglycerol transferase